MLQSLRHISTAQQPMARWRAASAAVNIASQQQTIGSSLLLSSSFPLRRSVLPATPGAGTTVRSMSSFGDFVTGGGGSGNVATPWNWPVRSTNTIVNIVPQGYRYVVERFGKMHKVHESGLFFAIPLVDSIAYVIDVRERALDIPPQSAITRDNVSVEVSGDLFVCFVDPEKAAYGALNPLYSVSQHAQSVMRSAIGEMELDEILHGRARLNSMIRGILQEAAEPWGMEIRRYEITEISPDPRIRVAMDKQAAAERDRREQVLRAEGQKRKAELESEGVRISLSNQSEGNLIKVKNEAEASKSKILLEAEAQAQATRLMAKAQAEALQLIAAQLQQPNGAEAARLALAKEYVTMYGEMGKQSNTILFNERPADVNALLAQAVTAMNAAVGNHKTTEKGLLTEGTETTAQSTLTTNNRNNNASVDDLENADGTRTGPPTGNEDSQPEDFEETAQKLRE